MKIYMKKIFIEIVGCCRRRSLDATRLVNYFRLNNCVISKEPEKSDYIILITCAYKKSKEDDCFKLINKFKNYKGELIVLGCLPGISPSKLKKEFKGKCLVTEKLDEIDKFFNFKTKFSELPDANKEFILLDPRDSEDVEIGNIERKKGSCFLRISRGCIANCSYCAIPKATGELKSKKLDICLNEYKKLLEKGYKDFHICAENVGSYGLDIGSSFAELLEKLSNVNNSSDVMWSIHEMHPKWVVHYGSDLIREIKQRKIVCLGCTIQSGSERILKLMNRYEYIKKIKNTLLKLKQANPKLYLYTHILVGFPAETEEDFDKTLSLIKQINFDLVIVYVYTDRDNTVALEMGDKISDKIKTERLKKALDFCQKEGIRAISDDVCFLE